VAFRAGFLATDRVRQHLVVYGQPDPLTQTENVVIGTLVLLTITVLVLLQLSVNRRERGSYWTWEPVESRHFARPRRG
jgi:hypothetical protein